MIAPFGSRKYIHFGVDTQKNLQLKEDVFMSVVDSAVVYPTFKSVKDKEITDIPSKLIFHYTCDSNKCEFPMTALQECIELKSCGIKETTEAVVKAIDLNPQLFTARLCGGYIFQGNEKSLVLLKNDAVVPNDETRFGFTDLVKVRQRLIDQHEMSKRITAHIKRENAASVEKWTSVAIPIAALYWSLYVLKRL